MWYFDSVVDTVCHAFDNFIYMYMQGYIEIWKELRIEPKRKSVS